MRRTALRIAVAGLIGLGLVGSLSGVDPLVAAIRALVGAVVLYVLVQVVGQVAIHLVVEAALGRTSARPDREESDGDHPDRGHR